MYFGSKMSELVDDAFARWLALKEQGIRNGKNNTSIASRVDRVNDEKAATMVAPRLSDEARAKFLESLPQLQRNQLSALPPEDLLSVLEIVDDIAGQRPDQMYFGSKMSKLVDDAFDRWLASKEQGSRKCKNCNSIASRLDRMRPKNGSFHRS